jgi:hypothetical protein
VQAAQARRGNGDANRMPSALRRMGGRTRRVSSRDVGRADG